MYSPAIAKGLCDRAHHAVSIHDRPDHAAAADAVVFAAAGAEARVVLTNNVRDHAPLAHEALQTGAPFPGVIFTSDRSLPRTKATIGKLVRVLDRLFTDHPADDAFAGRIHRLSDS
jgi:Domain of unknown function (DUF5615)